MNFLVAILFSFPFIADAYYLNTSTGAAFKDPEVKVYITSNSDCTNAGVDKEVLLDRAIAGAQKFWNRVPTSNLKIKKGGILQTTDSLFLTGKLCVQSLDDNCDSSNSVPVVSKIVIACNSNTTDNFTSSNILALTIPNNLNSDYIKGSVILVNDSASSTLGTLSAHEMENVLAHEIGHAVGLGHTNKSEALMYHEDIEARDKLSQDDIEGVSYLYPNQFDGCKNIFGLSTNSPQDGAKKFYQSFLAGLSLCFLSFFCWVIFTALIFRTRRSVTKKL